MAGNSSIPVGRSAVHSTKTPSKSTSHATIQVKKSISKSTTSSSKAPAARPLKTPSATVPSTPSKSQGVMVKPGELPQWVMSDTGQRQPSQFAMKGTLGSQSQPTAVREATGHSSDSGGVHFVQGLAPTGFGLDEVFPEPHQFLPPFPNLKSVESAVGNFWNNFSHVFTGSSPKTPSVSTRGETHVTEEQQAQLDKIQKLKKAQSLLNDLATTAPQPPLIQAISKLVNNRRIGIGNFAISGLNLQHLINGLNGDPQKILGALKTLGNNVTLYDTRVFTPTEFTPPGSDPAKPITEFLPSTPRRHFNLQQWVNKIDPHINFSSIKSLTPFEIGTAILQDYVANPTLKVKYPPSGEHDIAYPISLLSPKGATKEQAERVMAALFHGQLTNQQVRAIWFMDIMGLGKEEGARMLMSNSHTFHSSHLSGGKWVKAWARSNEQFEPREDVQNELLSYVRNLAGPPAPLSATVSNTPTSSPATAISTIPNHLDGEEKPLELRPTPSAEELKTQLANFDPNYKTSKTSAFLQHFIDNNDVKTVIISGDKTSYRWDGPGFANWLRALRVYMNKPGRYFSTLLEHLGHLVGSRNPTLQLFDSEGNFLKDSHGNSFKPFRLLDYLSVMDPEWSADKKQQLEKKLDQLVTLPKAPLMSELNRGILLGSIGAQKDKKEKHASDKGKQETTQAPAVGPVELPGPWKPNGTLAGPAPSANMGSSS